MKVASIAFHDAPASDYDKIKSAVRPVLKDKRGGMFTVASLGLRLREFEGSLTTDTRLALASAIRLNLQYIVFWRIA